MARSKKYQEFLFEHLADHDEAVAYLNAALEESLKQFEVAFRAWFEEKKML
jgi:DNA-binding phage protein